MSFDIEPKDFYQRERGKKRSEKTYEYVFPTFQRRKVAADGALPKEASASAVSRIWRYKEDLGVWGPIAPRCNQYQGQGRSSRLNPRFDPTAQSEKHLLRRYQCPELTLATYWAPLNLQQHYIRLSPSQSLPAIPRSLNLLCQCDAAFPCLSDLHYPLPVCSSSISI